MKFAKIITLAILLAFFTTGMALAAGSVKMNSTSTVSASVKNNTSRSVYAAVKMMAFDAVGTAVGHLCREVYLRSNQTTPVSFSWQAPNYETGLYWTAKVDTTGDCGNHDQNDDHDHEDDSDGKSLHFDSDDHH
ncbi:MAG: hypothetical protein KKA54_18970 [Proteobacteria bacterium]|nr:hypothetical protein [Pseudomonadota bacterium]MBU0968452.1 hypothetical protein [Pseudomonadota bacterium]